MKKLLALVLALVMTLGLATVGTNAAATKFGDDASIKYTEAAAVMSAIGVFDGDDSSNFRPTETLKRSEAAKIVAYLMLTKKTADGLVASGSRYNDVPANHWAAGYIEYLTSAGVLGGVGDGKFNPDGDIATVDFAKMLLVALGFDAKIENLVLSDYRINTVKLANEVKLFEGNNDVVATNAITRDEASLYAFNLIKTAIVEYDNTTTVTTNNDTTVKIGNGKAHKKTTTDATQKAQSISWKREDNTHYYVEFGEQYYPDLKLVGNGVAGNPQNYSFDDMGRPVRKWSYKNVDLGTYTLTNSYLVQTYTAKVTRKTLYDLLGKSTRDNLKSLTVDSTLYSYLDGEEDLTAWTNVDDYIASNDGEKINDTDDGVFTEVYRDDDDNVIIVSYSEYVYQVVSDYNDSSKTVRLTKAGDTEMTLENNGQVKLEDYSQIKDFKADDYVLVTLSDDDGDGRNCKVTDIKKATVLTGEVSAYSKDAASTTNPDALKDVTINGEVKKYAGRVTTANGVKAETFSVGKNATVVLNSAGYIVAVDEAVVVTDYVLVRKWGKGASSLSTKAYADAIFSDGTSAEINVKEAFDYEGTSTTNESTKSTIVGWGSNRNAYRWYSYSKNSSNEYTLSKVNDSYSWTYALYNYNSTYDVVVSDSDKVAFFGSNPNSSGADGKTAATTYTYSQVKANDRTVMVLRDWKDDMYTYTGAKNLAKVTLDNAVSHSTVTMNGTQFDAGVFTLNNKTGYAIAAYVEVNVKGTVSGSSNDSLIYVKALDRSVTNNDKTLYQYKVFTMDNEETTEVADGLVGSSSKKYYVANYASRNKDGQLTNFQEVTDGKHGNIYAGTTSVAGKITYSKGTITFEGLNAASGGSQAFTVDSNTKTMLVKLKGENDLLSVKNEDFERLVLNGTGAKQVADDTQGKSVYYNFVGRTTNDHSNVLTELYVTIGKLENTSVTTYSDTTNADAWFTANANAGDIQIYEAEGHDVTISSAATVSAKTTLIIRDAATIYITANPVTVNGTLQLSASTAIDISGHVTVNGADATLDADGKTLNVSGNSLLLDNGSKANIQADTFNITGNLTVQGSSELNVEGKSTEAAVVANVADGCAVNTENGSFNIDGSLKVSAGDVTLGNTNIIDSLTVEGGTVTIPANKTVSAFSANFSGGNTTGAGSIDLIGGKTGSAVDTAVTITENAGIVVVSLGDEESLTKDAKVSATYKDKSVTATVYSIDKDTTVKKVVIDVADGTLPSGEQYYEVTGSNYTWTVDLVENGANSKKVTVTR